ncbi:hypothetical protein M5E87_24715 [Flavonifractor plautii]|nr:hypothetical protein M5E87_24715 [Flavonifractor plautii]
MEQELRRVYYDPELGVEACLFQGIDQGFPEHFHTYYVIGAMDRGEPGGDHRGGDPPPCPR